MNAPEPISAALPPSAQSKLPAFRGIAWWALAITAALLTARLTMYSVQYGCVFTMVIFTVGLYVRNRTAGMAAVWVIWLVTPFLRRIFLLGEPIQSADPLALAPFLVTAAVIALELTQVRLSQRVRRLLILATLGYAVGIPVGLSFAPAPTAFGSFAYLTALGCLVIGYREADDKRPVLPTVLTVAAPLLALYAFRQYYLPLPEWDRVWMLSADINSVGSPDTGRIRVWSTLNSPGIFATVLGVAALLLVTWRRVTPLKLAAVLVVFGGLALTYVRSAWVGVVFAAIAVVVVTRGTALKRLVPVLVLAAALAPAVLGGSTGAALTDRLKTFTSLGTDESAQTRTGTGGSVGSLALTRPLGSGVGSAGEPSRLQNNAAFRYTDNGYLSLLAQVGLVGFIVVVSVMLSALAGAWRNAWRRRDSTDVAAFAVLTFFAVTLFAGDQLYGFPGMIFWYTAGLAMRRRELYERTRA